MRADHDDVGVEHAGLLGDHVVLRDVHWRVDIDECLGAKLR